MGYSQWTEWYERPEPRKRRHTLAWVLVSLAIVAVVALGVCCWRRRRRIERAKAHQRDQELNLPMAVPCESAAVPYARVVDVAETAPDHDDLLPATAPPVYLSLDR
ncbi:hypothetical protein P43SY_006845 [Pythium insidiosum]|uniref:Uncharacterized protein n=1 Tax=Pythium insidiosum TaxID=114742 RepID=A0AAD5LUY2_PYTIN|nr:hypothetical protein P43SY_006845 [Pythium insidiosum]